MKLTNRLALQPNSLLQPFKGSVTTLIIGAGQAGLAMSRCLTQRAIDHVVLERGKVANSWRTERWDSLRLLTPNWKNSLPGYRYQGDKPNDFMTTPEFVQFIQNYAETISAPVHDGVTVTAVDAIENGYRVTTNVGQWQCRSLVVASGAFNIPNVPSVSKAIPTSIETLTTHQYLNPTQLEEGGVLIVGGSATGLQLAEEIQRSGREVTLSVGEHVRMPRCYRGRDIFCWMDDTGISREHYTSFDDVNRVRKLPSPQLVGTPEHSTLDLNKLRASGVNIVGRFCGLNNSGSNTSGLNKCEAQFSGALNNICKMADLKMNRLLDTIDTWIEDKAITTGIDQPERFEPTIVDKSPTLSVDLASGKIKTVIWATGYRPDYSWLNLPVLNRKGLFNHDGGVVNAPGLYTIGLPFMRTRQSSFIGGVSDDAYYLSDHLTSYLDASFKPSFNATS
ncbi:MAG: NAD(P)-binding domain-containing protein [Pseudomonadales bacterium]|nr:NAD(P)-binding domain-containing protein [Pseudomonadales bacterium]